MDREYVKQYLSIWSHRLDIPTPRLAVRKMKCCGSFTHTDGEQDYHISINKKLLSDRHELEDTILHELIHAKTSSCSHNDDFKHWAKRLNVKIRVQDT